MLMVPVVLADRRHKMNEFFGGKRGFQHKLRLTSAKRNFARRR